MENILSQNDVCALLSWYRQNHRKLPWRETRDPYHIWISEIMLQQTRVEAVKPYYAAFLAVCPTVQALASVSEEKLMKLWEGLGYYSRARNLQRAAREIMERHGGVMPRTYDALRRLSGIGDYTAGAIASIAFGERVPAVDGNVMRVLSRFCGSYEDITRPAVKTALREALMPCVPKEAGDFTQALIELGATVCVPNGEPKCALCPLRKKCEAEALGLTDLLPIKGVKKARRIEKKTVFILSDGKSILLHKRPPHGLLAGLYELPNLAEHLNEDEAIAYVRSLGLEADCLQRAEDSKHIFTHIEWHMIAYFARVSSLVDTKTDVTYVAAPLADAPQDFAVPSAFAAYKKYFSV